jgi:TonB family protein
MRDFRKTSLRLAAAFAAILLAARVPAQDFSDVRMREGEAAYRARRFADAASFFRVAAFGYLDRPPMLCQALVRLALASDAAGRPADVKTAMDRLADALRRAPTCAEAEIDATTRLEFEARFRRRWSGGEAPSQAAAAEASAAPASPPPAADDSAPRPRPTRPSRRATQEPAAPAAPNDTAVQDGGARLKTVVHPVYPRGALQAHVGGVVILRVLVSEEGIPLQVEVVQGIRPDLNAAAVTAIKRCLFEPARVAGRPVRSSTTVSVPFQP